MRIVWKDSTITKVNSKYRGCSVEAYGTGWVVDISGDNNVYRTNRCAKNAIDKALGYENMRNNKLPKRIENGIDIIGTKSDKRIG